MDDPRPFVVLYRWRLHAGRETAFIHAWSRVTEALRAQAGSLGSRLHRGSDGSWYGYAQWPDRETRERASVQALESARAEMRAAIAENFPEVVLETMADFLILPQRAVTDD